jgi:tetratricopeptide (TPR) repeat protein
MKNYFFSPLSILLNIHSIKILYRNVYLIIIFLLLSCSIKFSSPPYEVFLDDSSSITITEIVQNHSQDFIKKTPNHYFQGFYSGAVWIKLNGEDVPKNINHLELDNPNLNEITFYTYNTKESLAEEKFNGRYISSKYKDLSYRNPIFTINPEKDLSYYIRIKSDTPISVKINLLNSKQVINENLYANIQIGIFLGVIIFFLLNIFIIYIIKRQVSLLIIALYILINSFIYSERWMIFPELSGSYNLDTSFFDFGLDYLKLSLVLIYTFFLLDYIPKRVYSVTFFVINLGILFNIFGLNSFNFYFLEIETILIGLGVIGYMLYKSKITQNFNSLLFTFWIIFILKNIVEIIWYYKKYNYSTSIPITIFFIIIETSLIYLTIHFQDSIETKYSFDPSEYIPDSSKDKDLTITDLNKIFSENEIKLLTSEVSEKKLNVICISFINNNEFLLLDKPFSMLIEYINGKYTTSNLYVQLVNGFNIFIFFEEFDKVTSILHDIYNFNISNKFFEEEPNIGFSLFSNTFSTVLNLKDNSAKISMIQLESSMNLSEISASLKLGILSFSDISQSKTNLHTSRFIGIIKDELQESRDLWEIQFFEKDYINYFEIYNKGMILFKENNYKSAIKIFEEVLEKNPEDEITKIYLKKSKLMLESQSDTKNIIEPYILF